MNDLHQALGTGGYVGLLALGVNLIVSVLRSGKANAILAKFKVRPIPKSWVPWLALVFGVAAGAIDAYASGVPRVEFIRAAIEGLVAGGLAIAGYELGPRTVKRAKDARAEKAGPRPSEDPKVDKSNAPR